MIITISGTPGSGKSTIARILAEKLTYKRYYMGEMFRDLARRKGMPLRELLELGEKQEWIDKELDDYQRELGQTEDNFVIEGRTSFLMIPSSLKLFITVDPIIGAQRIFKDLQNPDNRRNEDHSLTSVDAVLESNRKRMATDTKRYHQYYHSAVFDPINYDFVLDTSTLTPKESFARLWSYLSAHLASESGK